MIFIKKYKRKIRSWIFKKQFIKQNFEKSKRLIIFFVPNEVDEVSGGILSICTIFVQVKILKNIHNCTVIASFLPKAKVIDHTYSKFENDMVVFDFQTIENYFNELDFLEIQIPEYMTTNFQIGNRKMNSFFSWIKNIKTIKINILNQNDLLMRKLNVLENLKQITPNISMTVAHEKYANIETRNFYGVPLHLFLPWTSLKPYEKKAYELKENIIIISPDDIDRVPSNTKVKKEEILAKMKSELPDYEFITIRNLSFDDYKKIISRAKFTLTFGEGMDGYFCESILSGSISFAVYNTIFFTPNFKNLPTVYDSFDTLLDKIVLDIKHYDHTVAYKNYQQDLFMIINNIYSFDRFQNKISDYYLGKIDFN